MGLGVWGGGGSPDQTDRKNSDNALNIFSSQLILHRGSKVISKKTIICQDSRGALIFQGDGEGPTFS